MFGRLVTFCGEAAAPGRRATFIGVGPIVTGALVAMAPGRMPSGCNVDGMGCDIVRTWCTAPPAVGCVIDVAGWKHQNNVNVVPVIKG